jgi:amino acid transporter
MAMALGTSFAATEAGDAVPLCYVFAMIGSFALAYVIVRFARRRPGSGVAFSYVDSAFGKTAGFTAGLLYALAWLFAIAVTLAICAVAISAILGEYHHNVSWFPFFLAEIVIVFVLNYLGVKPSVRTQVLAEVGSMIAVTVIFILALSSSKMPALSLQPFNPHLATKGWGGIGYGMIYGFSGFAGFEGAAALGFETKNPRRGIPRAIIFSLLGAAVFYIFVTYALAIGFGPHGGATWGAAGSPLATILTHALGPNWATAVEAMVALSGFSAGLGLVTLSTRVLHGMSLSGLMPAMFRKEHVRFRTPYIGVAAVVVVACAYGVWIGLWRGANFLIGFTAGATTLGLIAVYIATSVGAIVVFGLRGASSRRWIAIVVPIISCGLLVYAFYASVIPVPAFPYSLAPYIVLAIAIIAIVVGFRLRTRTDIETEQLFQMSIESPDQARFDDSMRRISGETHGN